MAYGSIWGARFVEFLDTSCHAGSAQTNCPFHSCNNFIIVFYLNIILFSSHSFSYFIHIHNSSSQIIDPLHYWQLVCGLWRRGSGKGWWGDQISRKDRASSTEYITIVALVILCRLPHLKIIPMLDSVAGGER